MTVSVSVADMYNSPVKSNVYIQILDNTGRIVYPTSLIAKNESSFMRMISTRELKRGRRYMIKVATNIRFIYMTYKYFETNRAKSIIPLLLIPGALIPQIMMRQFRAGTPIADKLSTREKLQKRLRLKQRKKKLRPGWSPIKYLVFHTELDSRVCPKCRPYEGRIFTYTSKDLVKIGPPELGGDTHWNCRCFYVPYGLENPTKFKKSKDHEKSWMSLTN